MALAALTQLPLTKLWPIVALNMCCIITGCAAGSLAASTNLITTYRLDFDFTDASVDADPVPVLSLAAFTKCAANLATLTG